MLVLVWHSTPGTQRKGLPVPKTSFICWQHWAGLLWALLKHCTPFHTQPDTNTHRTFLSPTYSFSSPTPKSPLYTGSDPLRPTFFQVDKVLPPILSPESKSWLRSIVWERSLRWCPMANHLHTRLLLVSVTCAECEGSGGEPTHARIYTID